MPPRLIYTIQHPATLIPSTRRTSRKTEAASRAASRAASEVSVDRQFRWSTGQRF